MNFFSRAILVLITSLMVNSANAVPPQRLIIQFEYPLTTAQQQAVYQKIESTLGRDIGVLPHSIDQRWIVTVEPTLNEAELVEGIKALLKLDHVQFAEPDRAMKIFPN